MFHTKSILKLYYDDIVLNKWTNKHGFLLGTLV